MKIALLTIWHEQNYGAEMQAYATIKALQMLGHEVQMIDIRLSDAQKPNFNGRLMNFLTKKSEINKNFEMFWHKYIPCTRRYATLKDLQQYPPEADCYLVGSDQVWNPAITGIFSLLYFIPFGNAGVKKISYASSFGTSDWKECNEFDRVVRQCLKNFKAVSCREISGVKLLKDHFNIEAKCVLDPTLLHQNYDELISKRQEKNTVVFYPLSPWNDLEKYVKSLSRLLKKEYLNTNNIEYRFGIIPWRRPRMEDWIKNISEASLVVTPSFHGVALSIIYHRQFIVVIQNRSRATRILNILENLGLQNRVCYSIDEVKKYHLWDEIIDYSKVNHKLQELKEESYQFLKDNLK